LDITVANGYVNGIILKPPVSWLYIKDVLNVKDTNTAAEIYSRLYRPINLFAFRIYNIGS
jgi:hypothetical protein